MGRIRVALFVCWWWWWWCWCWCWWERRAETTHLKWCSCHQFTSSFSNAGTRASARRLAVPPCLPWLLPRSVWNLKDLGKDDYLQDAMNPYFKGIWRWELYVSSIWWLGVPAISRRFTKAFELPGHLKVQWESHLPEGFYKELVIPGLYKDEHPPWKLTIESENGPKPKRKGSYSNH